MKMLISICLICLPLKHLTITSNYGYRIHPLSGDYRFHAGIDLRANHDTVYAVFSGRIAGVHYDDRLGINIYLQEDPWEAIYGHLSQVFVTSGDTVFAGDPIAISGATGQVTGEHLHFSIRCNGRVIDPISFLSHLINYNNHE